MEKPSIDNTAAVFQAGATIGTYLSQAIEEIDRCMGEGYAAKHPALLAECVRSQTLDFNSCALTAVLYEIKEAMEGMTYAIEEATGDISLAMDRISSELGSIYLENNKNNEKN